MPHHPLTNFEILKYYQNEPRFNGAYSRDNLSKRIKDGAYIVNLDKYANVGPYWTALSCGRSEIVYFDSVGFENVPEEFKEFIGNKTSRQTFFEYKQTLLKCVTTSALVFIILCLLVKF